MSERGEGYQLLRQITLPIDDYVKLADRGRIKPYIKNKCRLPQRFLNKETGELLDTFKWNHKDILVTTIDNNVVIANTKSAGKPRYKKINGQDIYNGNISRTARATFVK